ncbi:MAG: hypothetical protein WBL69_03465, partial [Limnochordia bacterium]
SAVLFFLSSLELAYPPGTAVHYSGLGFIKLWGLPPQVYAAAHKHPVDRSWRDHTWPNHLQQNSGEDVLLNLPKSS